MEKNNNTSDIVDLLPLPNTIEEQSMYALICALAKKKYEEPFNDPVKRSDQYWRALYLTLKDVSNVYEELPNKADKSTTYEKEDVYSKTETDKKVKDLKVVVESFIAEDGEYWYRRWSDGWLEQGGVVYKGSALSSGSSWQVLVELEIPYISPNYQILLTPTFGTGTTGSAGHEDYVYKIAEDNFTFSHYNRNSSNSQPATLGVNWYTCGFGAI